MRTLLICHDEADLDRIGLARWLASFSELAGMIVIRETRQQRWRRVRREIARVGPLRFLDVLAFRLYAKLFLARPDRAWERTALAELGGKYPDLRPGIPVLHTHSPNTPEAEQFVRSQVPDIMLARCKMLLREAVFSIPSRGTFVLHPGLCPEYRNAHGCFWALANDDLERVVATLLRVDRGIDTGPVYGYYGYAVDEENESHTVIQHRVVLENLDAIQKKLIDICTGVAHPLETTGRASATWGQPWLTRHLRWKYRARRRR